MGDLRYAYEWYGVYSSAIEGVRGVGADLDVRWVNGKAYRYVGAGFFFEDIVSGNVGGSIGDFVNKKIKPKYRAIPLEK